MCRAKLLFTGAPSGPEVSLLVTEDMKANILDHCRWRAKRPDMLQNVMYLPPDTVTYTHSDTHSAGTPTNV